MKSLWQRCAISTLNGSSAAVPQLACRYIPPRTRSCSRTKRWISCSICTQAPQHAEVAVAAAEAGVHVLCEKPLAIDLESADGMLTACHRAGVHLAISHQYRFSPSHRYARELVELGRIGALRSVREFGKGREAGFELMETGVHSFDEMDFLLDGIESVHAHISYEGRPVGVQDIMESAQLCRTDRRDNGSVAGDTMIIQLGGRSGGYGILELYPRKGVDHWMTGPHLLGSEGQLMVRPGSDGRNAIWDCESDGGVPHGHATMEAGAGS